MLSAVPVAIPCPAMKNLRNEFNVPPVCCICRISGFQIIGRTDALEGLFGTKLRRCQWGNCTSTSFILPLDGLRRLTPAYTPIPGRLSALLAPEPQAPITIVSPPKMYTVPGMSGRSARYRYETACKSTTACPGYPGPWTEAVPAAAASGAGRFLPRNPHIFNQRFMTPV